MFIRLEHVFHNDRDRFYELIPLSISSLRNLSIPSLRNLSVLHSARRDEETRTGFDRMAPDRKPVTCEIRSTVQRCRSLIDADVTTMTTLDPQICSGTTQAV